MEMKTALRAVQGSTQFTFFTEVANAKSFPLKVLRDWPNYRYLMESEKDQLRRNIHKKGMPRISGALLVGRNYMEALLFLNAPPQYGLKPGQWFEKLVEALLKRKAEKEKEAEAEAEKPKTTRTRRRRSTKKE
jgi:hypothetical protein